MIVRVPLHGVVACLLLIIAAPAVWATWPADGMPVVTAINNQEVRAVVPDGADGAIVVWHDKRSSVLPDIYAQRVSADGTALWAANGVPVCTNASNQLNATAASDGAGGVIVTWEDYRGGGGDIYAQRIDASGAALWATDGELVCGAADVQVEPRVISFGSNDAVIAWFDRRSTDFDIYAQRIDGSGAPRWTSGGKAVSLAPGDQKWIEMIADGTGGILMAWEDYRAGNSSDIYAQRLDFLGDALWTGNGVAVCTDTLGQGPVRLAPDGAGGGIIAWSDSRSGVEDIYAQRIDAGGTALWPAGGELVCGAVSSQLDPFIVSDDAGGAIVAWTDFRDVVTSPDVYAQRIDGSGGAQWTPDGVLVSGAYDWQYLSDIATDGAGGAFLAWSDDRGSDTDVYVQRLNHQGVAQGTPGGDALCSSSGYQFDAMIAGEDHGCAIVAWTDTRGGDYDVVALNTGSCAASAVDAPAARTAVRLSQNYPNPFSGTTHFEFELFAEADATVEVFDALGRRVHIEHHHRLDAGRHGVDFVSENSFPSGVYYYRVTAAGATYSRKMVLVR